MDYSKSVTTETNAAADFLADIKENKESLEKIKVENYAAAIYCARECYFKLSDNILYDTHDQKITIEEFKDIISNIKGIYPDAFIEIVFILRHYPSEREFIGFGVDNFFNDKIDNYVSFYTFCETNPSVYYLKATYLEGHVENYIEISKFYEILSLFSPKRIVKIGDLTSFKICKHNDKEIRIYSYNHDFDRRMRIKAPALKPISGARDLLFNDNIEIKDDGNEEDKK